MEGVVPIQITVYDKNYNRKGFVTAPLGLNVLLVWNAPGLAVFSLDASHPRVNNLVTPGARCVVTYRVPGGSEVTLLSGLVSEMKGSGSVVNATREFAVLDDLNALNEMIAYPVPAQPLSNQSAAASYIINAPLETLIKTIVSANVSGQGIPRLTVAADSGAGRTIRYQARMHNLGEYLLQRFATREGMGVRIVQTGTTRQLQTWIPATYPRVLTEESGVVTGAEFSLTPPEVTRVVVGIGGEGTAREFYGPPTAGYADTTAETLWGIRRQEFIDARDIEKTDANKAALALERATERLEEGRGKASVKAELIEAGSFRYGSTFSLGDQVSIRPAGADVITDRVREVEFDWSASDGLVITPRVGEWQDSQKDRHWRLTQKLLRRVNELGAR